MSNSVKTNFNITMISKSMDADQHKYFLLGAEAILNALIRAKAYSLYSVVSARDMVLSTTQEIQDGLREDFEEKAKVLGVPAEWYGKVFKHNRTWLRVVGIDLSRPKKPIKLVGVKNEKPYKCSTSFVIANGGL